MWSVVCFNFAIRSLYVVSKVVGLAPISVTFKNFSVHQAGQWARLWQLVLHVPLAIVYPISWCALSRNSGGSTMVELHPNATSTANMNSMGYMVQYAAGYMVLVMISIMQMGRRREDSVEFLSGMVKLSHKLPSISDTARNYQQQRHSLTRVSMCKNLVALFLLKSILFGMILLTATWSNLNSHFEDTLTMSTFLHSLVILFPTLLMVILSNGFYGASLLLAFYLMLLNRKLSRITEELSSINVLSQTADQSVGEGCTRLAFHQHQLHFSDEIDNIAILYGKVVKYIAKLHEYFTLSVLLIITHSFMNIILELFNIYLALVTEDESINYTRVPIELFFVILNYLEIFFVVHASMASQKQMDTTVMILNQFHTDCLENRLRESVEFLFMQVLQQDNVKIRPCGLFPVDYTLITSIICSICSYLVISVQFYMMH